MVENLQRSRTHHTGRASHLHRTLRSQRLVDFSKVLERENTHQMRPLGGDQTHPSVR
jgi:hypothetical protein